MSNSINISITMNKLMKGTKLHTTHVHFLPIILVHITKLYIGTNTNQKLYPAFLKTNPNPITHAKKSNIVIIITTSIIKKFLKYYANINVKNK